MEATNLITLGFALTMVGLLVFFPLAKRLGLVDHPGGRKIHQQQTPLVGGLAMFSALIIAMVLADVSLHDYWPLISACSLMVFVGLLDDIYELRPWLRVLPQVIVGFLMIYWAGARLYHLGDLVPSGVLGLSWAATPITILAMVGVINAINLIDGLDGLAGLVTLPAFVFLAWVAGVQAPDAAFVLWVMTGALVAFLCLNLRLPGRPHALVFMGDSGSMLLGLLLVWHTIELTQPPLDILHPVTALWLLVLPLFDTVGIMIGRIMKGQSPFEPDQFHLHHRLLARGYSVGATVAIMGGASLVFALVGMLSFRAGVPDWIMFALFLALFAAYYWKIHHPRQARSPDEGPQGRHPGKEA